MQRARCITSITHMHRDVIFICPVTRCKCPVMRPDSRALSRCTTNSSRVLRDAILHNHVHASRRMTHAHHMTHAQDPHDAPRVAFVCIEMLSATAMCVRHAYMTRAPSHDVYVCDPSCATLAMHHEQRSCASDAVCNNTIRETQIWLMRLLTLCI